MVPPKNPQGVRVWVRTTGGGWPDSAGVEDVGGVIAVVRSGGPWCFFEDVDGTCRMGLGATCVARVRGDFYRVRFGDGSELTVKLNAPHQWERPAAKKGRAKVGA